MGKNSYARLLGFANTTLGKFVAVVVAIAMVCSLTSAVYAIDVAIEAWADNEGTEAEEQETPDYANVNFVAQNCAIELGGQQVSGSVAVTPGTDLVFSVVPAEGYLLSAVYAADSLSSLPVEIGLDQCVILGDFVYGDIHVEAIAAVDPDNPQEDTTHTPIGEDTTIGDGQIIPDPILDAPVITLADATQTYNATPLASTNYTVDGLLEGDELIAQFEGSQTDVGSSTISVAGYVIWRGENDVTGLYQQADLPSATITVEPAPLYITTPSAEKAYDGQPLVYEGTFDEGDIATVADLWGEDQVEFAVTGSQTNAGSSPNTYSLSWVSGDPANYEIIEDIGTLTVLPAEEAVYVIAPSASKIYDGTPIDAGPVTWSGLPEGYKVEASYEGTTTDTAVVATSVLPETVRILDASGVDVTGNYTVETLDGEVIVEHAALSVFTESASKEDDGKPLTAYGTITGFVNGETASFTVTGSQNGVGSSVNTYEIEWNGTANPSNYIVYEDLGSLDVFEAAVEKETTVKPASSNQPSGGTPSSPAPAAPVQPVIEEHITIVEETIIEETVIYVEPEPVVVYPSSTDAPASQNAAPAAAASTPSATSGGGTSASSASDAAGASASSSSSAAASGNAASSGEGAASSGEESSSNGEINPVVGAVATGMQNLEQVIVGDEPTPLAAPNANEEIVTDDETPLGVFDEPVNCWVHWYAIFGLIATAVYAAVVMFFRRACSYELESREAAVLGVPVSVVKPQVPASSSGKAGKEA